MTVTFLPSGDTAIVIEFGDQIDRAVSEEVLRLAARIHDSGIAGILELVPTFRSLLVHYDPLRLTAAELIRSIQALPSDETALTQTRTLWHVPVCYEGELAPDLGIEPQLELARAEPHQLVASHAAQRHR